MRSALESWVVVVAMGVVVVGLMTIAFACPGGWTVHPPSYEYNGSVTAQVFSAGAEITDGGDCVSAWYGGTCRGVVEAIQAPNDEWYIMLMCHANTSGEYLTFKFWDDSASAIYDIAESIEFVPDMTVGSLNRPYKFNLVLLDREPRSEVQPG